MGLAVALEGYSIRDEGWRYPDDEDWQKHKAVYRGDGFVGLQKPEWSKVPSYCTNLNEINRLEERLNKKQRSDYYQILAWKVCNGPNEAISASSSQRAIAMARTLNLTIEGVTQ